MIFILKMIGNDFYYKNALEMIFIIKMHWNDFYYKNDWKWFLL